MSNIFKQEAKIKYVQKLPLVISEKLIGEKEVFLRIFKIGFHVSAMYKKVSLMSLQAKKIYFSHHLKIFV